MSTTFVVTAAVDVVLGLQVGLALSIAALLFQLAALERHAMGQLNGTHAQQLQQRLFVALDRYPDQASERPGIRCYKYTGFLWFGNATKMRDQVLVGLPYHQEMMDARSPPPAQSYARVCVGVCS